MCSLYEFIYSFRKSVNSPFPDITSDRVVNALTTLKKMKKEIASGKIFHNYYNYYNNSIYIK